MQASFRVEEQNIKFSVRKFADANLKINEEDGDEDFESKHKLEDEWIVSQVNSVSISVYHMFSHIFFPILFFHLFL